ncbi:MAG TPA: hypothetical protein VGG42_17010 [Acidobacteriaceae bacterium]|jgi:hypothetical protein
MRWVLRRDGLAVCLLGLAFLLQFQMAKHWSPWSAVNPFSEDPYDAVGSFAVQFVLFMMFVSLVRAFRPCADERAAVGVFRRGTLMTAAAVGFTCLSDLIAMARHRGLWLGRPQGIQLFAVTALLLFWSAAAGGWFLLATREACPPARPEMRKLAVPGAALILLAVYPEHVRNSVSGAILTALCGAVLLFVAIRSAGTALLPTSEVSDSDLVDDVVALVSPWRRRPIVTGGNRSRKTVHLPAWLSRRRSGWILPMLIGLVCGAFLVGQELAQPGPSPHGSRRILVISVYLFLESAGVLTGYWLLAEPLRLFRRE